MPSPPGEDDSGALVADLHRVGVPAQADRLPALRQLLTNWATNIGMVTERVQALTLAVHEAMANVVTHAYRGVSGGVFDLHAVYCADSRQATVTITDFGSWLPAEAPDAQNRFRLHGRGLLLIQGLADAASVNSDDHGTTVRMEWSVA
ncbi:MAG TPA: ATP-binding protein [Pseudonocardiaceae bacterium]|nr:ATP-binding protein [Pseudonocardiaceae bacterium]